MKHLTWGLVMATGKTEKIAAGIETGFLYLNDRPVLAYSLAAFMQSPEIDGIVICIPRERAESVLGMVQLYGFSKVRKIVAGSAKRAASMAAALAHVDDEAEWICVHDASRLLLSPDAVSASVKCAHRYGSGVAGVPMDERMVTARKGVFAQEPENAGEFWAVRSPQTWPAEALRKAYPASAKARIKNYEEDWPAMVDQGILPHLVHTADTFRIRDADDLTPALSWMQHGGGI